MSEEKAVSAACHARTRHYLYRHIRITRSLHDSSVFRTFFRHEARRSGAAGRAALLLAALLLVPYPSGAAARISGENAPVAARADGPHIFHLKNGLTIAVKEDSRFPLASVRLYVNAGSAWEQPGEAGISHLLEHMVFKGSKTGPKGVDKRVENAGRLS